MILRVCYFTIIYCMAIRGWKSDVETDQPNGTKLVYVYHTGEDVWKEL